MPPLYQFPPIYPWVDYPKCPAKLAGVPLTLTSPPQNQLKQFFHPMPPQVSSYFPVGTSTGLVYLSKTCFTPEATVCKAAWGSPPARVEFMASSKYLMISSLIPPSMVLLDKYQDL